jgi:REP element-mobilizing transposase RayT
MDQKPRFNPNIHHRRSIRLKGYDYSRAGLYFVTICVQDRECLFGEISNDESPHSTKMVLNDAGQMIKKWYDELENKFPDIQCHEMIVMPNHFHCIVENTGSVRTMPSALLGADLRVCPNDDVADERYNDKPNEYHNGVSDEYYDDKRGDVNDDIPDERYDDKPYEYYDGISGDHYDDVSGEHVGSPLHRVVQWFKTMTTNEYIRGVKSLGWKRFNGKLWQRNYYERIVCDQQSYQRVSEYIRNNPAKWAADKFHK